MGPVRSGPVPPTEKQIDRVLHHGTSRLGLSGLAPTETIGNKPSERRKTYDWNEPRRSEVTSSNPQDSKEDRGNAPFVAFGIIIGAGLGVVVFAVTQNPFWLAIAGLGIVVGASLQANRR